MNIKEMHIEVQQGTQNIAGNTTRKLMAEQIDWLLNKNQERFIDNTVAVSLNGKAVLNEMELNKVRTLVKIKEQTFSNITGKGYGYAFLPDDFMYLLSDVSYVKNLCGSTAGSPTSSALDYATLKVPVSTGMGSPKKYYKEFSITIGTTTVTHTDINTFFQSTFEGFNSATERYVFVSMILHYLRNVKKIEVYWEYYGELYFPSTLIFPGITTASIQVDGATAVTQETGSVTLYTQSGGSTRTANRLVVWTDADTMQNTPFVNSNVNSPVSFFSGNFLNVFTSESFIISKVGITYLKKPRLMCLSLNQDCELPEKFHQGICDLTVEYFRVMITDPAWQLKLEDNMRRSPTTI